jgi:3-oxoacyl-[acyl-carrier protein] reductase
MAHTIDLSDRVCIVTGGGHGIGASIARTMARAGARTVVNYRRSEENARAVVDEIVSAGGEAFACQADVTDRDQVERMKGQVVERWGLVDIVVNNALDQKPWKPFMEQPWEIFQSQIDGSLKALCNMGWAFIPGMQERKWGRIINISTVCFIENMPGESAYNAGKGAMYSWSRTVAREVAPDNITINQIAPGWMRTEKVDPNSPGVKAYAEGVPMKRQGDAQEIANAALFFASDLADFITSAYLPVCGGLFYW